MSELTNEEIAEFFDWDYDMSYKGWISKDETYTYPNTNNRWTIFFNELGHKWDIQFNIASMASEPRGKLLGCFAVSNSQFEPETHTGTGKTRSEAFMNMLEKLIHANI